VWFLNLAKGDFKEKYAEEEKIRTDLPPRKRASRLKLISRVR